MATIRKQMKTLSHPSGNDTIVYEIEDEAARSSIASIQTGVAEKADKVAGAVEGNLAGLDENGNIIDSGSKPSDFAAAQDVNGKADKTDTVLETTLSRGRNNNPYYAVGEGSFAFGNDVIAEGAYSHAEGFRTQARDDYQHVFGRLNVPYNDGNWVELVGNGTPGDPGSIVSNARMLDWLGNEYLGGDIYVRGGLANPSAAKKIDIDEIEKSSAFLTSNDFDAVVNGKFNILETPYAYDDILHNKIIANNGRIVSSTSRSVSPLIPVSEGKYGLKVAHDGIYGDLANDGNYRNGYGFFAEDGETIVDRPSTIIHKIRDDIFVFDVPSDAKYVRFTFKIGADSVSQYDEPTAIEYFNQWILLPNATESITANFFNNISQRKPNGSIDKIVRSDESFLELKDTSARNGLVAKADKDTDAVEGNFASFDSNGNPVDSGHKHSDYLTAHQDISGKADKADTVLDTTLSRGRKANTTVGTGSFAFGDDVEASGDYSHAEGSGSISTAEAAHAEGSNGMAAGDSSHVEGLFCGTCSEASHAEGTNTLATRKSQHVFGENNVWEYTEGYQYTPMDDPAINEKGEFIEIVGNGDFYEGEYSNARTLDWDGNERLAGDLYVHAEEDGTGGDKVATEDDLEEATTELKSALFENESAVFEQGGVVLASGWLEDNSKRCRTNKFFLKKGATFTIVPNGLYYNFAKYKASDGSYTRYKGSWTEDNATATFSVDYDAYIIVWVRNSSNTDLAPADVTTTVVYQNDLIVKNADDISKLQTKVSNVPVLTEIYPSANGVEFSGNTAVNDPLIVKINNIFYFRNISNPQGVAYLNRPGDTFSVSSGYGLYFDLDAKTLSVIYTDSYIDPNKVCLIEKEGLVINGHWAVYYYNKSQYTNAQGQTVWTVGVGYIPTIQAACNLASDGDIIFIKCGTYTEQVSIWTRKLHLIGEDKVNTILIDHSGYYDTPPLEMAMGSLSNMTIIEDGSSPSVSPETSGYNMAYCLHIEHPDAAGETFVIDNCDFINDIHVPLGCGMRANNTVHFRNCTFRCNATSESTSAERGGFFVHAQNHADIENQYLILENCIISSAGPRLAMMFGVPANASNTGSFKIRLSNCCIWNENRGVADNAVGWDTSGGADVMEIVHSYGNTIARLNSTT